MAEVRDATKRQQPDPAPSYLGDFTVTRRVLLVTGLAVVVGAISSVVALALLRLIGLVTNIAFFGRVGGKIPSLADTPLPPWARLLIPIGGGLVVGLMARYGSERIRGHGMPETIEVVLTGGSKVAPRVAVLKPLSAAVSIGSGGPFGAEGPIIMTGGAVGSVLAQFLRLTADERKTLLVAGSVSGMAAVFNSPLAAVLLAVELLLFEYRPRSLVPVAASVATATICRGPLLGYGTLFPTPDVPRPRDLVVYLAAVGVGVAAALLAAILTSLVYFSEDSFHRLPIHWMWWPAIGGLIIGVGGIIAPSALGVGYPTIADATAGRLAVTAAITALVVKSLIWSLSLGSGTSGGVVAPLLFVGSAGGIAITPILPHVGPGFWAAVAMGAALAGAMRVPMTAVVFTMEVTHAWNALLPVLLAAATAYLLSVLMLKRSILTEKVSRKGFHLSREYDVDPLEVLFVHEVMSTDVLTIPQDSSLAEAKDAFLDARANTRHQQRLFPVVDDQLRLVGVITHHQLIDAALAGDDGSIDPLLRTHVRTCYPDETLRAVTYRMADEGVTRMIVVDRDDPAEIRGVLGVGQVLEGRLRDLKEARDSERVLRPRLFVPRRRVRLDAQQRVEPPVPML